MSLLSPLLLSRRRCRTSSHIQVRTSFVASAVGLRLRPQGALVQPELPSCDSGCSGSEEKSTSKRKKVVFLPESRRSVLQNAPLRTTEGGTRTRLPFQGRVVPENPAVDRSSGPDRHQFQRHWLLVWFQFVWVCSDVIGQAWSRGRGHGWASAFAGGVVNAGSDWSRQGQLT